MGDLRQELIRETVRWLEHDEPDAVSLRALARRLGVSSGAPYHHFPDKLALLAAIAEEGWALLEASMADADRQDDPRESLRERARAYVRFALHHPAHYRVMFLPALADAERFAAMKARSAEAFVSLAALVVQAIGTPEDPTVVPTRVMAVWSTVHGFVMLHHAGHLEFKAALLGMDSLIDGMADAAVRAALDGA